MPTATNPYDVLAVSPAASRTEIVRAVAVAMKARRHPPRAIAEAQKVLMHPGKRLLADYLRPILPTVHRMRRLDAGDIPATEPELRLLPALDGLQAEIARMTALDREERTRYGL